MSSTILGEILGWEPKDFQEAVLYMDDGFSEAFKWQFGDRLQLDQCVVLPFLQAEDSDFIRRIRPKRIAFFVSTYLIDCLDILKSLLTQSGCTSLVLVTSSSAEACKVQSQETTDGQAIVDYGIVRDALEPNRVSIVCLPMHIIPILNSKDKKVL